MSKGQAIKDNNIIELIQSGQEELAVKSLYDEVMPNVKSYILKNSGDHDQAKDAFHDALVAIIVKIRKNEIPQGTDIKGYLFVVAKNVFVGKKRRDQKVVYKDDLGANDIREVDLGVKMENSEKSRVMDEMLTSLGDKCKDLLKLTFYLDYSLKEASKKLGFASDQVAKTTQYRCKKKLFAMIKDNQGFRQLMGI